jgi:hypothetical protein
MLPTLYKLPHRSPVGAEDLIWNNRGARNASHPT